MGGLRGDRGDSAPFFSWIFNVFSLVTERLLVDVKMESARTSSITWTKLCTKIIYILLQTSVLLFQIHVYYT